MKQITPPALTEVRDETRFIRGMGTNLVFDITNQSLELLLELASNARTGHDS